jgi:hypothetical protein
MTQPRRERLPNRRLNVTFDLECGGLPYTCTVGRFRDGGIAEVFLNSRKSNSAADTNARDVAIVGSIAFQHGADLETIRNALCRDGQGPSRPLGMALDRLVRRDDRPS